MKKFWKVIIALMVVGMMDYACVNFTSVSAQEIKTIPPQPDQPTVVSLDPRPCEFDHGICVPLWHQLSLDKVHSMPENDSVGWGGYWVRLMRGDRALSNWEWVQP